MQFKQIVLLAAALLPFASGVVGAPTPVVAVVGEDGLVKRQCTIEFKYTYCGGDEADEEGAAESTDVAAETEEA